jgi:signal peptidase I
VTDRDDGDVWSSNSPPDPHERPDPQDRGTESVASFLRELPVLVIIALTLAFLLRTFVIQVFFIPSGSMEPTLQVNDRMVVEKVTYRFRDIGHGDIVVFEGEDNGFTPQTSGLQRVVRGVGQFVGVVPTDARDFVKRVIGLPGDEVVIEDGIVTVNGVELSEPYADLDTYDGTHRVPDGSLFVMGDNRRNSSDSRYSLGFIEIDDVVGRAVLRIWPLSEFGGLAGSDYPAIPDEPPSPEAAADPAA